MTIFAICAAISLIGIILYLLQVGATCSLLRKTPKQDDWTATGEMNYAPPVIDPEAPQGT